MKFSSLIAFLLTLGLSGYVHADACKDVLINGTKKDESVFSNQYVRHFLLDKLEAAHSSSSKDTSGKSGDLGYGKVRLKLASNKQLTQNEKDYLKEFLVDDFESDNSYQSLVSSGDPTILNSWLQCMQSQAERLLAYFSDISSNGATFHLRWSRGLSPDSPSTVTLLNDVIFPAWVHVVADATGGRCWKKSGSGRPRDGEITTAGCPVVLSFDKPDSTFTSSFTISAMVRQSTATASLPARIMYQVDQRSVPISVEVPGPRNRKHQSTIQKNHVILDSDLQAQGFSFVPDSFLGKPSDQIVGTSAKWYTRCGDSQGSAILDDRVEMTANVANEAHIDIKCRLNGTVQIARIVSLPQPNPY